MMQNQCKGMFMLRCYVLCTIQNYCICICFRYRIVTDLSARVSRLNPQWNSQNVDIEKQFEKAMALVLEEFLEFVQYARNVWLPAKDIVRRAVENRFEVRRILLFISLNIFLIII